VGESRPIYLGRLGDAVLLGDGDGKSRVLIFRGAPGECLEDSVQGQFVSKNDRLFVLLSGSAVVSSRANERVRIHAGQGAYFPKGEAWMIFADTTYIGLLIEGDRLRLAESGVCRGSQACAQNEQYPGDAVAAGIPILPRWR